MTGTAIRRPMESDQIAYILLIDMYLTGKMLTKDMEIFHEKAIDDAACGNQADTDRKFEYRREIVSRYIHRREYTIQPIHDHSDDNEPGIMFISVI